MPSENQIRNRIHSGHIAALRQLLSGNVPAIKSHAELNQRRTVYATLLRWGAIEQRDGAMVVTTLGIRLLGG